MRLRAPAVTAYNERMLDAARCHRLLTAIASATVAPAVLLAAAGVAWQLLSFVDFGYPFLYDALDIRAHIDEYGPQNRYRSDFETLTPQQHQALFGDIVAAINRGGAGLETLHYQPPNAAARPLLRPPEIAHLRLVADWVTLVHRAAMGAGLCLLATVAWLRRAGHVPGGRAFATGGGLALVAGGGLTVAAFDAGDGGWFARLHEWAFPPGHQWFFYYQESLMTTLMKAPELFGPMAAELAGLTLGLTAATLATMRWWLRHD